MAPGLFASPFFLISHLSALGGIIGKDPLS